MSEPPVNDLLTVAQAIEVLDQTPVAPRIIEVNLVDAQGLRLAEDVRADRDYPPFDKSLMDGYAVRGADVAQAPVELRLTGEIAAGQSSQAPVGPGDAMAIMTGAPMPPGADGVVPVEDTQRIGDRVRILKASAAPSRYTARRGHDCRAGTVVLARGTVLQSAQLSVAATVGAARVQVYASPGAAVLSTGDELVPIDQTPGPAQIRNSNNLMLVSLLRRMSCTVRDLGTAIDRRDTIAAALEQGMASADLLFVTGGMSMGAYDFVPQLLIELGVETKITKVRIKPGKPFVFGVKTFADGRRCYVFGLPGNPVSGFVCTVRLASRLVRRLLGAPAEGSLRQAVTDTPLPANGPREFYQPCRLDGSRATPLSWKGSADVFTLAQAHGLIVRRENAPPVPAGQPVDVLEI